MAFDNLSEMRQNSPTGGALGNVSDTELRLLSSTLGSLDPRQGGPSLRENIALIKGLMNDDPSLGDKNPAKIALDKWRDKNKPTEEKPAATNEPPAGAKKYRWDPVKKQKVPIP
jgi:hypothetical protein